MSLVDGGDGGDGEDGEDVCSNDFSRCQECYGISHNMSNLRVYRLDCLGTGDRA
ncbi:MAG: hypothetical protein ACRC8Y_01580 [Chroococcales cyanobacterium]